jgi:flagellar basal-body rod modification protein FlgD
MTSVTSTTATAATPATTSSASSLTSGYTSDMFLKLLVTQLQNQDPSSPMDSTQMISQTSQLAEMQQLTSMASDSSSSLALQQRTAAANVLGKTVTWTDADSGDEETGTVTAVSFSGTAPTVTVNGTTVNLSDLSGIAEPTATSSTSTS